MGRIRYSTLASLDLIDAADFHEEQRSGDARRFFEDVAAAAQLIAAHPEAGEAYWRNVRRFRCHTFPYYVYYQAIPDGIRIVAIGHQSRKPTRWKRRIQ